MAARPELAGRSSGRLSLLDRSDLIAISCLVNLASRLIRWDDIAAFLDAHLPEMEGRNWYAPSSSASMVRSYFLRRWFDLTTAEFDFLLQKGNADYAPASDGKDSQFDYFFEHYQLKELVLPELERQLLSTGLFM